MLTIRGIYRGPSSEGTGIIPLALAEISQNQMGFWCMRVLWCCSWSYGSPFGGQGESPLKPKVSDGLILPGAYGDTVTCIGVYGDSGITTTVTQESLMFTSELISIEQQNVAHVTI